MKVNSPQRRILFFTAKTYEKDKISLLKKLECRPLHNKP
ncbi:hypothetical protein LEP1GSC034_4499 [Leptospira interrogans str. 2003000735]|uniref:Uncharacterized protein n=1 Tax=Leptospira interrogans str. UI 12758 TaxID=1049938 RepID=A0A0E2CZW1_LEPIR|nr:hypothetical protein LEP1GSC045_1918 [Leptospira interrogans serovar Pomona str. Kennewicki LC82-25]EJP13181.1 hypothetical protein LEP1GSC080_0093 [Leptospira interrogans str. FPW2026]EKN88182.1 hypothetical protein LEP1GSC027_4877 [Leptospira interrogans str. 2002000624]EKN95689.1 hypothetical protein LEP1GSC014_1761 [Leptospira interrogans serovar Pomona str. Pomona]EKO08035.1 hypothetical protein LEP1GSC077_1842 [Leptospira interrogans str. C10069]EKP20287.1 hypothetical protein LEP1GSC